MDDDNNIFDKDDALDYVIYEDINKKKRDGSGNGGCLGIVILLIFPVAWGVLYLS